MITDSLLGMDIYSQNSSRKIQWMESCSELGSTKYWMNDDEGTGNELTSSMIHGPEGSGERMVESRFTFSRSL